MNKFFVIIVLSILLSACSSAESDAKASALQLNNEKIAGCINHANILATNRELELKRSDDSIFSTVITMNNCRYYFFNKEPKIHSGFTEKNLEACESLRPKLHAEALHFKKIVLSTCLSMNGDAIGTIKLGAPLSAEAEAAERASEAAERARKAADAARELEEAFAAIAAKKAEAKARDDVDVSSEPDNAE